MPDLFLYLLCGSLGGVVGGVSRNGFLELPHLFKSGPNGGLRLYLGALQGVAAGALAGVIGDASPLNSFIYGVAGSKLLDSVRFRPDDILTLVSSSPAEEKVHR